MTVDHLQDGQPCFLKTVLDKALTALAAALATQSGL